MTGIPISFDGNSLQTSVILTQAIDHGNMPTKAMPVFNFAHANGSSTPFVSFPGKPITISGVINGSSIADCDNQMDIFKGYFNGQDKYLDIGYNGSTRRYVCSAAAVSLPRPGYLQSAEFTVSLGCTQPFGIDITPTTALSATGRTLATYNDTHFFVGSAPQQLPIFTITYASVTATGLSSVTIGNGATGQQTTITRVWVPGDALVINTQTSDVTVNGSLAEFTGAIPFFDKGTQTMTYNDTHTTRSFSETVIYNGMYH